MKLKLEMSMRMSGDVWRCLSAMRNVCFSNYSTKSKCYDDSNKLGIGNMQDETSGVAIGRFVGLKQEMFHS